MRYLRRSAFIVMCVAIFLSGNIGYAIMGVVIFGLTEFMLTKQETI